MRTTRKSRAGLSTPSGLLSSVRYFLTPAVWKQAQSICPAKRKRRWDMQPLILALLAMTWLTHPTVEERFQVACSFVIACRPKRCRPGRTVPGFLKAVHRLPVRVFHLLSHCIRHRLLEQGWLQRIAGFFPVGVDGSRLSCPRTLELEERLPVVSTSSAPQVWITALVHLLSGVPWWWRIGKGTASERSHLEAMLSCLPFNSLIVADAGFVSYALYLRVILCGHQMVVRMKSSVQLFTLSKVPMERFQQGRVLWWPEERRYRDHPPIPARLVRIAGKRNSGDVWLLTTVLDRHVLSRKQIGKLYRLRWENECFFRSYKRTLGKVKLWGRTIKTVHREVEASLLAVQLLLAQVLRSGLPQQAVPSLSRALRVIRNEMDRCAWHARRRCRFDACLRSAVRDRQPRHASKIRKEWPRKKVYHPPKPPQLLTLHVDISCLLYPRHTAA